MDLVAGGHVEIVCAKAARAIRIEDQCFGIGGERRGALEGGGVDGRPKVHGYGPWVKCRVPGGDPQIAAACAAGAVRGEDHLQAIMANCGAGIATGRGSAGDTQFNYQRGWAEGTVGTENAGVDVPVAQASRTIQAREIEGSNAGFFVLEERRAGVFEGRINSRPHVNWSLPGEVVMHVHTIGDPDVEATVTSRPVAVKKEPVAVARKGRAKVDGRGVDDRSEILGRTPGIIHAGALRNPDVIGALTAGPIGGDVEA